MKKVIPTAVNKKKDLCYINISEFSLFTSSDSFQQVSSGHPGALIAHFCAEQRRWICWGLGRPVWPEAGAMHSMTGTGQSGNGGGGESAGHPHSFEL